MNISQVWTNSENSKQECEWICQVLLKFIKVSVKSACLCLSERKDDYHLKKHSDCLILYFWYGMGTEFYQLKTLSEESRWGLIQNFIVSKRYDAVHFTHSSRKYWIISWLKVGLYILSEGLHRIIRDETKWDIWKELEMRMYMTKISYLYQTSGTRK